MMYIKLSLYSWILFNIIDYIIMIQKFNTLFYNQNERLYVQNLDKVENDILNLLQNKKTYWRLLLNNNNPIIVLKAKIINDIWNILLLQRNPSMYNNSSKHSLSYAREIAWWKIDTSIVPTIDKTVILSELLREIYEETWISKKNIKRVKYSKISISFSDEFAKLNKLRYFVFYFEVNIWKILKAIKIDENEHHNYEWCNPKDIDSLKITDLTKILLLVNKIHT